MKHRLFVFIFCTIIAPQIAEAQYSFTISHYTTGNCNIGGYNFDSYWRALGSRWPDGGYFGPFNTLSSCESARQYILTIPDTYNINTGSCRIHYGATPCTGFSVGSVDYGNSNDIILGVSKGRSFYSPNSLEQILNWEKDDEQRQKALNYDYETYTEAQYINTGNENFNKEREKERNGWYLDTDKPFRSLNVDETGGINTHSDDYKTQEITNDQLWYAYLNDYELFSKYLAEYYLLTGIDIENILSKEVKTLEDLELISQFEKWSDEKISKEERYKDMAISSALAYSKEDEKDLLLSNTSNVIITNQIPKDSPLYKLDLLINLCNNDTDNNQGFHADIIYNSETDEYTVAFRGSEGNPLGALFDFYEKLSYNVIEPIRDYLLLDKYKSIYPDWSETNIPHNLQGEVPTQYRMAIEIGDVIRQIKEDNPDIKINITGHSLGGGLGITAGVVSGQPTYVFNPAGVHPNTYEYAGVSEKVEKGEYNIIKFTTDDDPLTNLQEILQSYVPQAIGEKVTIHTNEGHDMTPIAQQFSSKDLKNKRMRRMFSNKNDLNKCRIYTEE